jgi:hypothetical protein
MWAEDVEAAAGELHLPALADRPASSFAAPHGELTPAAERVRGATRCQWPTPTGSLTRDAPAPEASTAREAANGGPPAQDRELAPLPKDLLGARVRRLQIRNAEVLVEYRCTSAE